MLDDFYKAVQDGRWLWYLEGLGNTLLISLGAIAIGCVLGVIISLIKYTNKKYGNLKILSKVCDVYLPFHQRTFQIRRGGLLCNIFVRCHG